MQRDCLRRRRQDAQVAALRRGAEIVVACPGRLLDLIDGGDINLSNVEVLVLDEADRMCDMGFCLTSAASCSMSRHVARRSSSATMPEDIRLFGRQDPQGSGLSAGRHDRPGGDCLAACALPSARQSQSPLLFHLLEKTATGRAS